MADPDATIGDDGKPRSAMYDEAPPPDEATRKQQAILTELKPLLDNRTNAYQFKGSSVVYIPLHNVPIADAVKLTEVLKKHQIPYDHRESSTFDQAPVIRVKADSIAFNRTDPFMYGIGQYGGHYFLHEVDGNTQATKLEDFRKAIAQTRAQNAPDGFTIKLRVPDDITEPARSRLLQPVRQALAKVKLEDAMEGRVFKKKIGDDWTFSLGSTDQESRDMARIIAQTIKHEIPEMMAPLEKTPGKVVYRIRSDNPDARNLEIKLGTLLADITKTGPARPEHFDSKPLYTDDELSIALGEIDPSRRTGPSGDEKRRR